MQASAVAAGTSVPLPRMEISLTLHAVGQREASRGARPWGPIVDRAEERGGEEEGEEEEGEDEEGGGGEACLCVSGHVVCGTAGSLACCVLGCPVLQTVRMGHPSLAPFTCPCSVLGSALGADQGQSH